MKDYSSTAPARLATRLAFFASGFALGSCAPLFPFIKANVSANERQFGMLLLCLGLGSIIAMPVTGLVSARRGARPMIRLGGAVLIALLPMIAMAATPFTLGLAIFIFGAALGTIDVAMNIHGAEVESVENRPLMSSFHAQFSIGAGIGAGLMTLLMSLNVSLFVASIFGSGGALLAMSFAWTRFLSNPTPKPEPFALPRGIVLLLAVLAGISFLVEGAVLDWGALLLVDRDLMQVQNAGMGFIFFSITMVIARLTGDRLVMRVGEFTVLFYGGLLTILGLICALTTAIPPVALLGFALIGLGIGNLVPILFSAAGRQTLMPKDLAIASVTTTGYAGVLLGPALVGFVAEATSLSIAFWVLSGLVVIVPFTAKIVVRA